MRILSIFLLLFLSGYGQTNTKLKFAKLSDDLYVYTTYQLFSGNSFPSNSMYLVTDDGVVLFDTPWDKAQFQPLLDSIEKRHGKKVIMCIATHFHDDRTAGLEYYKSKGVKTYTSKLTHTLCVEKNEGVSEFTFEKDTVFNVGGKKFEAYYPGEGHTKDNIVIWIENEKILFGGCLVKSIENHDLGNIADANLNAWAGTVENVLNKYPKISYVVPGHFAGTKGKKSLKHTIKLLEKEGYK